jgi:thiamine-monophosphate kinase
MPLPEKALIAEIRLAEIRRLAQRASLASSRRSENRRSENRHSGNRDSADRRGARVLTGIGDDCAILQFSPGHAPAAEILVTTDFSLEGIHFRRDWHAPEVVGHRCLTRGLSDIAAMGGEPVAAFLSLALPRDLAQSWVRRFTRGLMALAEKYRVPLAGGDTAESPDGILADIVVVGAVPKGKAILRSGARPGDRIFVSGSLGGSAAAVVKMMATGKKVAPSAYPRHFHPEPRLELGRILREKKLASAMIDLSDGLSTDLAHICEESGFGAEIDAVAIPRARVGRPARLVDLDLALHGGEDYELLFTVPPGKHIPPQLAGVALTPIGHITRSGKILMHEELVDEKDGRGQKQSRGKSRTRVLIAHGWEHFRA